MRTYILTLTALVATVLADGASIVASLKTITADTVALNESVTAWSGDVLGTLPIITKSATLLHDIKSSAKDAEESEPLTDLDAFNVAVATLQLASDVNSTLTTIIAYKPKFDHLLLSPVILLNLKLEKDATEDFSAAVVSKVPAALQEAAQTLIDGIDQSFDLAIEEYDLF